MTETTVFIVYHGIYGHINDIEAIFETQEQVNAFKKRFAKNESFKVVKKKINPRFIAIPDKIPYLVCFDAEDLKPVSVTLLFSIDDCAKAAKNAVEKENNFLYIYLLADNKVQAIRTAQNKRDELI